MAAMGFVQYCHWWIELGGNLSGAFKFMLSEFVISLPMVKIRAQLRASLVTGNDVIQSGDSGDVRLLSTAIPLAHFVLTDKRMERRITQLEIDREWNTKIFSMSSIEGLFSELAALQ